MAEHDAGYRGLFSDKRMVADLIRGFVHEPWVKELDFETLESVSGSFVSEQFQKRENDVIWRVRFRGAWLYVYLLIEFQSTVERFMSLDTARTVNVWFLAAVALWRVLLLGRYLEKWTDLSGVVLGASLLLPLALVIVALTLLNLEQAVFDVMSGLREDGTAGDKAYQFLFLLSGGSFLASPILALIYAFSISSRRKHRREAVQHAVADGPSSAPPN